MRWSDLIDWVGIIVDTHRRPVLDRGAQMRGVAGQQELAIGQIDQHRAFARRMAGGQQKLDRAVAEQVEIPGELRPVVSARRQEIVRG